MSISQPQQAALGRIIGGIGTPDFAMIAADAIRLFLGFDLAAALLHRRGRSSAILFENFAEAGAGPGIQNYARFTHGINPILKAARVPGAFRASDFRVCLGDIEAVAAPYLMPAQDEELGFRTTGWPELLEEVGLYFEAADGLVELGFYRERCRTAISDDRLVQLSALGIPVAAAFERDSALSRRFFSFDGTTLSPRERQIVDLLLQGCGSEAIALRLDISRYTVKDHRKHIFRKLGISSLSELFAMRGPHRHCEEHSDVAIQSRWPETYR